jgi:hypothetical protein
LRVQVWKGTIMKTFLGATATLALAFGIGLPLGAPASAQSTQRVLTIFGNDSCPTSNGEEIVVCQRLPENERFRIPKNLRTPSPDVSNQTWADRAQSLEYVGREGTNSCTPSGGGGWTGCWSNLMRSAKQERRQNARASEASDVPLPD